MEEFISTEYTTRKDLPATSSPVVVDDAQGPVPLRGLGVADPHGGRLEVGGHSR